jgi:hypothetical protein
VPPERYGGGSEEPARVPPERYGGGSEEPARVPPERYGGGSALPRLDSDDDQLGSHLFAWGLSL